MNIEEAKNNIGKEVFDSRGRKIGKLISFSTDLKGNPIKFLIELVTGDFIQCNIDQLQQKENSLVYFYSWEVNANTLKDRLELVLRRIKALEELYANGEIEKEIYLELKSRHESSLAELEDQKKSLIEKLYERKKRLELKIKALEIFLANSKMQQSSGEISGEAFKIALESINIGLKRAFSERSYIKEMIDFLSNVKTLNVSSLKPTGLKSISEDVVLVKLKEPT
ncbi:MAG: CdvA-like protein [Candidatus Bathyarchaeia archaeon]